MEIAIVLIRNGMTSGGKDGKYVGNLDEPLLREAKERLLEQKGKECYPAAELVFCSPMLRCRETAEILYPSTPVIIEQGLRALDIGDYSGQRYNEIVGDQQFYKWADDRQLQPLGKGEAPYTFMARCNAAFRRICEESASKGIACIAVITHNNVINTVIQRHTIPRNHYKYWRINYGGGVVISYDTRMHLAKIRKIF